MFVSQCLFCSHDNPQGAKFCNECGSPLHLRPCWECDAINDAASETCYKCGAAYAAAPPAEVGDTRPSVKAPRPVEVPPPVEAPPPVETGSPTRNEPVTGMIRV